MNAIRKKTKRVDWLILAGLLLLSAVPVIAGAVRVAELTGGAEITPQNARFFASPLPVVLHIVSVTLYSILGAFQFAPGIRRWKPGWHRAVGKWVLVPSGLIAALSGLWMTHFYPWPEGDGTILYGMRLFFGLAMVLSIILGAVAIRRRNYAQHGAWMMRGYAIGLGAGTQVFTHLPWILLVGQETPDEFSRALMMGAGWVINLVVVEWVIRKRPRKLRRLNFPAVLGEIVGKENGNGRNRHNQKRHHVGYRPVTRSGKLAKNPDRQRRLLPGGKRRHNHLIK